MRSEIIYLKMDQGSCKGTAPRLSSSVHYLERVTGPWEEAPGDTADEEITSEKTNPLERPTIPGQVPKRKAAFCSCDPLSKLNKEPDDSAPTFLLETLCPWEPAAAQGKQHKAQI